MPESNSTRIAPMNEPEPDSPFAEIAQPKPSAVEAYKQRSAHDQKRGRQRQLFLINCAVAGALGAGAGIAIGISMDAMPTAVGMALLGSALGLLVGWFVAMMAWARFFTNENPVPIQYRNNNSWDTLTLWLFAWGLIGIACGASIGAMKGTQITLPNIEMNAMLPWTMVGALIGEVIGASVSLTVLRTAETNSESGE